MGRLARRPALVFLLRVPCKAPENKQTFVRIIVLFTVFALRDDSSFCLSN